MKKLLFSTILILAIFFANAQTPTFDWVKGMGGTSSDGGNSIEVDAFGNVYTTGYFAGTVDFDPGLGIYNLTAVGGTDIFISKLDQFGNFLWAKNIVDSTGGGVGNSIALDPLGNVYTTGYFQGTADFDPGLGTYNLTPVGYADIFILKLDSIGNFVWARQIGGIGNDQGVSITLDSQGNIYTTGGFQDTADFDPGAGVFNLISTAPVYPGFQQGNIFVTKLNSSGNFVWAKSMVSTTETADTGNDIAVDLLGNVFTIGSFVDTVDFDPGSGVFNLFVDSIYSDVFISKLDASGNFIWAKQIVGTGGLYRWNYGYSIALDDFGNVFTTGLFQGTADFNPSAGIFNLTSGALYSAFISKLDFSGNFVWAKSITGTGNAAGNSIVLDTAGNIYTAGEFTNTIDFDPGVGVFNLTGVISDNIFISKLDPLGNFVWAKNMGGTSSDEGLSIALDSIGNIYTTGEYAGTADFDPDAGVFNLTSSGLLDFFVHKMSQTPTGIIEIPNQANIVLYPNPTNNFIDIETSLKHYSISVFDNMGKLILKEQENQNKARIDVSGFSNGLYFIQLKSDEKIINTKFVKQ